MSFLLEKPYEFLVSTVGQYVVDTWKQSSHIENHLKNLQKALSRGHELIRRSECWRIKHKQIDEELPRLKDALYEAESVVNELEYQRLKHQVEKNWASNLNAHFKNWMNGFPKRVKAVEENLSEFCNQMEKSCNELKIPENHNQFIENPRRITTKIGATYRFRGRDKEWANVINLLGVPEFGGKKRTRKNNIPTIGGSSSSSQKNGNVEIVSIVGMGGVGKTTLAQMVYTNEKVKNHFKNLIWICISETFDVKKLIKEIIEQVTNKSCHDTTLTGLQEALEGTLKSRRFLLVLDDAWSEDEIDWLQLLGPMRGGQKKSAILLTTRSQKVSKVAGKCMNKESILCLEGLEKNIYWELFESHAFDSNVTKKSYPELENIGRQICEKLKGSPLAAKTIGGLLKANMDVGHWSSIRDSKIWQLEQGEDDILPVLQLSYQYLSSDLKRCFSFCSLYPKDYKFTKKELFNFWMMHGFINPKEDSQQARDVSAGVKFDLLEGRGFFQKVVESNNDEYVIHDLLHDVCQSITKDECFCIEHENFGNKVPAGIRHLSVFLKRLNREKQNELAKYNKLLSLSVAFPSSFSTTLSMETCCNKLTSIQRLSLVKCNIRRIPRSIENLKHLQYLDISESTIVQFPDSFCSLYNLKYLNMNGCKCPCSFPDGSEKLINMQTFYYPREGMPLDGSVMNLAKTIIANCSKVKTHGNIHNLRHIDIRGSLTINELELVSSKEAAKEAELNKKPLINDLCLCWSSTRQDINENKEVEVLEGLCPHPDLQSLTIIYYGGSNLAPSWLKEEFLPNLTCFTIFGCARDLTVGHLPQYITTLRIQLCSMQINLENCLRPENLPLLKELDVLACTGIISLPVESFGGFMSLEKLSISGSPKLTCSKSIVFPPSLKYLEVLSCGDIDKSIPTSLQNLSSLETLRLSSCNNLVSIPVEATSRLKSLSKLLVHDCAELQSLGGLQFLASVKKLNIWNCPKLEETGGRDIKEKLPSDLLANLPSSSQTRRRRASRARNSVTTN